jgi:capsular polysaccharide biosynthesis protein
MSPAEVEKLLSEGERALTAKDFDTAERHFTRATEIDPSAPQPLFAMARLCDRRGATTRAGKFAQKALARGLSGDAVPLANAWYAGLLIAKGEVAEGVGLLAHHVGAFREWPDADFADTSIAKAAVLSAVCAGDVGLASRVFAVLSPHNTWRPMSCAPALTVEDWCAHHGISVVELVAPMEVTVPASSPYSRPSAYRTQPVLFAALPGAQWVPGWDFVIASDGVVLTNSGYVPLPTAMSTLPHFYLAAAGRVIHYTAPNFEHIDDDVLFLSAPTSPNIGHWLINFLPRLRALDVPGLADIKIAVPENIGTKSLHLLALCGISEDRLIRCRLDTQYSFRTLHLLMPGEAEPPNPAVVDFVRQRLYAPAKTLGDAPKRIYLSRASVGTRQVANAQDFEALLQQEGFVSLDMADLSIAQQQEVLSGAEILMGVYGSNLLAYYFAPPGCTVITLLNKLEYDITTAPAVGFLGMTHQDLVCPAQGGRVYHTKDADLVVDCVELKRRLDEIESRRA